MPSLDERIERAREFLNSSDYFRILTHYDVDGVCSAGIIADYLRRRGRRFHISFFRNVDREEIIKIADSEERVILTDMGSSLISELKGNVLIVDHHQPPGDREDIIHVNSHLFGYDGSTEACASTLAYLIVGERRYAKYFLAGVFGDKQYLNGLKGLNKKIADELSLKSEKTLPLYGTVMDSLFYSIEPFFVGLSGMREKIEKILKSLKIKPAKMVDELTDEEKTKLGSYLALNILKNSKIPDAAKLIVDLDYKIDGVSVRYLAELIDSACRTDNQSIALGYILGSEEDFENMEILRREYRGNVVKAMYSMLSNLFEGKHIQYFYAEDSYLTSTLATIGSIYLLDPNKVTVGIHIGKKVSVSARVHKSMAKKINIGEILKKISAELGGAGGGHSVAAGATIPVEKEKEFLKRLDEEIEKSLTHE